MLFKLRNEYKNILNLASFFFLIIFFIRFLGELSSGNNYSWDTDHEMYFGARLLHGELLYTKEIHDKLPLVQYFFALPAYFKNVSIWTLFSSLISIFASFSLRNILRKIIPELFPKVDPNNVNFISNFCGSFYLFAISSLSGSLHMINHFAASCYLLSFTSTLSASYKLEKKSKIILFFISLIFASIAISFRPYYAPSLVLFGIWIPLRKYEFINIDSKIKNVKPKINKTKLIVHFCKKFLSWTIMLLIFIIILNATPYLPNNLNFLIDGIRHNSTSLQSKNIFTIIISQFFYLPFGFTTFTISASTFIFSSYSTFSYLKEYLKNNIVKNDIYKFDIFFIGFLSPLLLELAILNKHFWDHYYQLFIPFIAFTLAFLLSFLVIKLPLIIDLKRINKYTINFILIFLIAISSLEVKNSAKSFSNYNKIHPMEIQVNDIRKYIDQREKNNLGKDFLHISNMYVHWKLDESRYGFPHAANIGHIIENKWSNLKDFYDLTLPKNKYDICKEINDSGISNIFTDKKSREIETCFNNKDSNYTNLDSDKFNSKELKVFNIKGDI